MFNGQNIKRLSEIRGIKVKTICDTTGISPGSFYTILSERGNPTADNLEAIADFFECSIDDFFDRKSYHVLFPGMVIRFKMESIT